MADRPGFTHQNERHGLVGPFSGRQLALAGLAVLAVVIVLVGITTPLGNTARPPALENPRATAFIIGEPPAVGLQAGTSWPRS